MKGQDYLFLGLGAAAIYMVVRSGKGISDIFGGGATAAQGLGDSISSISGDVAGLAHEVIDIPKTIASDVNKTLRNPPKTAGNTTLAALTKKEMFNPVLPGFSAAVDLGTSIGNSIGQQIFKASGGGSSKTIRNSGPVQRVPTDYYRVGNFSSATSNTGKSVRNDGRTISGALRAPIFMRD